jgi:hypothetical protein
MTAKCDVAGTLDDGLSSTADKLLRYHSLNVARRIGAKSFARRIATELTRDESPELAAASLDALSCLAGKGEYAQIIIPFADSKSPLVRQMAARAMGRLQLPGSEDALIRLVAKGNPANVRKEAYEAMGRYPQQVFVPRLVACLKAVKSTGSDERAVAAWSLGQMRGGDVRQLIAAAQRLQVQCTKAVIPDVMPMFDDVTVIANAFWTLAVLAKRTGNPEIRKCYDAVVKAYDVKVEELEKQDGDGTELPLSEMTCCMIRQVRQYFEGREYTTMPVPTQELKLPVKQIK